MVLPSKVTEYVTFPEAVISAFTLPSGEARVQDFCAPREIFDHFPFGMRISNSA